MNTSASRIHTATADSSDISSEEFDSILRTLRRLRGFNLDVYKDKCIRRRIAVRMRACGVHTYGEYESLLERTPDEYERLRDALTINVTRFFRNVETWERLAAGFLPALWAPAAALRVWSAGCASGEEAYSLAILAAELAEARGRPQELDRVSIDATDIDRESLARAKAARYRAGALMETPAARRARYFLPDGDQYRVVEPIRRRVRVRALDLSREPPPERSYDLIVCRNVVIYFTETAKSELYRRFMEALRPGGILFLGATESIPNVRTVGLVPEVLTIYRRP
jgi:chemotaxis methyl-accepting protein methylase